MWRDEKTEYLRKNRDYSRLLSGDDGDPRGRDRNSGSELEEDDVSRKRHKDYQDRRSRLKELERQKLTKEKNGLYGNVDRDTNLKGSEKANGGSSSKANGGASSSKDKKKMPYDKGFGSFFGPSEPVVAKRIIEEARARQEAEIVAAREARVREAERQKSATAGKQSKDKRPVPKPKPKPVDEAILKARKLREARDYSFLLEDTPLPPPKADKKAPAAGKPGPDVRRESMKSTPSSTPARKPYLPAKSSQGTRQAERPPLSSRPLQSNAKPTSSKLSASSRPSSSTTQARADVRPSDRSALASKQKLSSSGIPLPSRSPMMGSGRQDPRRETDIRKEAAMRKLVSGSSTPNGVKGSSSDRREPIKGADRRLSSSSAQVPDRRLSQSSDRRPVPPQSSDRRPGSTQVLKKGSQASTSGRGTGNDDPRRQSMASQSGRQSLQSRPTVKLGVRPSPSGYNKSKYGDDPRRDPRREEPRRDPRRDEVGRRRARSPSEESDEKPRKKAAIDRRRGRSPNEESDDRPRKKQTNLSQRRDMYEDEEDEDDSFIDDDEDQTQVSNMIRKMFRYDPSKYRGMDDDDDRAMEVGFRTIQAEERKSAREARLEDERELALIEEDERRERLRKKNKMKRRMQDR
ncbi:hypothetical protein R1flu_003655 [Riccia fluitans]|uniref:Protein SPT2 homolog n=1 Tax=Riccia fluitans TaxID=41844 RepID=A0ABD1YA89_9MARC